MQVWERAKNKASDIMDVAMFIRFVCKIKVLNDPNIFY